MKNIFECCKLEIKLIFRSWLTRVFLPLLILYTALGGFIETKDSPGRTILGSAYLVEAGLFLFLVIGYNMIKNEEKHSCDEVFYAMRFGRVSKIAGKFLALVVTALALSTTILFTFYIFYFKYNVTYILYIKGIWFFALYYFLPFIIVGIIGMIIGILVRGKLSYLLIILFWFLVGTANEVLFLPILRIFKFKYNITPMLNFLNLAQTDPDSQFNMLYGFPLEVGRWYQKGIILTFLLTVLMLLIMAKSSRRKVLGLSITLAAGTIISIIFFWQYMKPSQIIDLPDASGRSEFIYYTQHKSEMGSKEDRFIINSYDIDMAASRLLKVDLKIGVKALKSVDKLDMTLYRNLLVKKVESEGEKLSFNQTGDFLTINLPKVLNKNEEVKIELQYEGKSSPYFFANEQAVMLPAYFTWIPREGNFQIMNERNGYSGNKVHEAFYRLKYKGPSQLYTNLPPAGNNTWEGTAKDGITLVASDYMGVTQVGDTDIYYPLALNNRVSEFKRLLENERETRRTILADFNLKGDSREAKVIFITPKPNIYASWPTIHAFDDHMILECNQIYLDTDLIRVLDLNIVSLNDMAGAKSSGNGMIVVQLKDAYAYWYVLRFKPELAKETDFVKRSIDPNSDYQSICRTLKNKIDANLSNENELRKLFSELLQAAKQKNEDEFMRLLGL